MSAMGSLFPQAGLKLVLHLRDVRLNLLEVYIKPKGASSGRRVETHFWRNGLSHGEKP
jgi:hypothetical protein